MTKWITLISLLLLRTTECQNSSTDVNRNELTGTWQLAEQMHSGPDDRPVYTAVSATPQQTLTLTESGQVSVAGERLTALRAYTTYRIDSTAEFMDYKHRLVFLPEPADADLYANFIQLNGDTLRLVRPGRGASSSTFVRVK